MEVPVQLGQQRRPFSTALLAAIYANEQWRDCTINMWNEWCWRGFYRGCQESDGVKAGSVGGMNREEEKWYKMHHEIVDQLRHTCSRRTDWHEICSLDESFLPSRTILEWRKHFIA